MYGQDILHGISKVPFEIPCKKSYPYIWKIPFLYNIDISRTLDLIARKHFWNDPPGLICFRVGHLGACRIE